MASWSDGCYWDVTACRWVPCERPVVTNVGEAVVDRLPSPRDSAVPPAVAPAGSPAAQSPAGTPPAVPAPGVDR